MQFQAGDILACYGAGWESNVIRWATWGPSHVGIVAPISPDAPNNLVLFESTTLCSHRCLITGEQWNGVQAQRITDRIKDYGGKVQRLSLMPAWELSKDESCLLSHILTKHYVGLPYDMEEALISGTRILKWSSFLPYPNGHLFCSELVSFCLMRLCRMGHDNPARFNPASMIRRLRREGKYGKPEWVDNRPALGVV